MVGWPEARDREAPCKALVKVDPDSKASAQGEAMLAYPLLITGFPQSPEMTVVAMVVAVIAQLPL